MLTIISSVLAIGLPVKSLPLEFAVGVWQTNKELIVQTPKGCRRIQSPGVYNTFPDFRILSRNGQTLALPAVSPTKGWGLYGIDLGNKNVSCVDRGHSADMPRVSFDGRYVSALVNEHLIVFDIANDRSHSLGKELTNIAWSPKSDTLLFLNSTARIEAYNAAEGRSFEPTPNQIDRLVGTAYRKAATIPQRRPMAEIAPSGKWAYVGVLKGGLDPVPINGIYHDGIGKRIPYRYGIIDGGGKLHSFVAPKAYENCEIYPLAWTSGNRLIFSIEHERNKILIYDPTSGKSMIRRVKPPEPGATLIAMKSL